MSACSLGLNGLQWLALMLMLAFTVAGSVNNPKTATATNEPTQAICRLMLRIPLCLCDRREPRRRLYRGTPERGFLPVSGADGALDDGLLDVATRLTSAAEREAEAGEEQAQQVQKRAGGGGAGEDG